MRRNLCLLTAFFAILLAFPSFGQTYMPRKSVAAVLGFENNREAGGPPLSWMSYPAATVFVDDRTTHTGRFAVRVERNDSSAGKFSSLSLVIPIDFAGKVIEWSGYIKTEGVTEHASLWMREDDGQNKPVGFQTMQGRGLKDTHDWDRYSLTLPVDPKARNLFVGFLVSGSGKGWLDDVELLVDGKPIALAPAYVPPAFSGDHEFDDGSQITLKTLTPQQVDALALLAKVWGFLKYHHPAVTAGRHHWDYELFRIMPAVLAAADRPAVQKALVKWVGTLEPVPDCPGCKMTALAGNFALAPDMEWITDETALGNDLSHVLQNVYHARSKADSQFFVSLPTPVRNPTFSNELAYARVKLPDSGYQLLALFRYWNIIQYFSPNREVMSDTPKYWQHVLETSIPAMGLAPDRAAYQRELIKFIAKINDSHANLWNGLDARPPVGECLLPVTVRFVEGRALVRSRSVPADDKQPDVLPGDIITSLDGVPVTELVQQWRPMYAGSNEAARLRDMASMLTRGACGEVTVEVERSTAQRLTIKSTRLPMAKSDLRANGWHDLPGDAFQKLADDIAYLKLSNVKAAESAGYIRAAAGTKGLIIDLRNYPSEFMVFTLGSLLVSAHSDFVRFTRSDLTYPGAFVWDEPPTALTPAEPHYKGKVVILVDEVTQSQAEYTTMAFRTAPGALVIGSTTSGADGNVSAVTLPGGFTSMISGIGVFYPDKRPTQRVGIIPDIELRPTIAGLRAGRDELVEEAIRQIRKSAAGGAAN